MNIVMYKSNRERKDKYFWGKQGLFYNAVMFDKGKAIEDFHRLNLTQSEKCEFIEEFIRFYIQYKCNEENQYWFNQSVEFIEDVMAVTPDILYKFTLEHLSQFEKKEDIEIFNYFKSRNILQNGYNNIFVELLNWFSHNEKTINTLLEKNDLKEDNISHFFLVGLTKSGKSLYIKEKLLNENCVVISQKDMNLKRFYEDDKEYFYQLLINLTIDNNRLSLLKKIDENKSDIDFKSIANYIKKRLEFECLYKKMLLKDEKNNDQQSKILKI